MTDYKRRFSRVPFKVMAKIIIDDRLHSTNELNNLSIGGCFLPVVTSLRVGTPCRVVILVSENGGDIDVHIEGVVVRCESNGIAIRFTKIDPDNLFHLKNIIRYNRIDSKIIANRIKKHPGLA